MDLLYVLSVHLQPTYISHIYRFEYELHNLDINCIAR